MKIIKHCHEEGAGNTEVAQGVLLGLVVEEKLEITNCFPFPRHADDVDEEDYQLEMMRHLRKVNVDHLSVGWYQSTQLGNFITTQLLESQYSYQLLCIRRSPCSDLRPEQDRARLHVGEGVPPDPGGHQRGPGARLHPGRSPQAAPRLREPLPGDKGRHQEFPPHEHSSLRVVRDDAEQRGPAVPGPWHDVDPGPPAALPHGVRGRPESGGEQVQQHAAPAR
ncbi:UNVERIFIED_CONTAM: hypothetical protein GTU68_025648 [Idotea baltica]|nr:hypothetical protein [Idotea baltica]